MNIVGCDFHPSWQQIAVLDVETGEITVQKLKPTTTGQMNFEIRDGIFKLLCDEATKNPKQRWIFVVDEINRGDISRIFGELLTLLEMDKRNVHPSEPGLRLPGRQRCDPAKCHPDL